MGVTGGNFIIAETGSVALVTNEGNEGMCTVMPRVHVAVTGIE
jgi:L-lactate dehydrogenase complex protein LldF